MGFEHFKQMYDDAVLLDCKAMPVALGMCSEVKRDDVLPSMWASKSFDTVMAVARKLVVLHSMVFLAELREMAAVGLIQSRAPVPPIMPVTASTSSAEVANFALAVSMYPPMVNVNDPAFIGSDDEVLSRHAFYTVLEQG